MAHRSNNPLPKHHAWLLEQGWTYHGRSDTTIGQNRHCYSKRLLALQDLPLEMRDEIITRVYVTDETTMRSWGATDMQFLPGGDRYEVELQLSNATMTSNVSFFTLFNNTLRTRLSAVEQFIRQVHALFMPVDFGPTED